MTPAELLAAARDLITRSDAATAGVWPRTSALLARQALEDVLDAHWLMRPQTAGMAAATTRAQLICLPRYLDETLARQVAFTYAALSNACHYHPYELAPTAAELSGWIEDVAALVARITVG
ncbi:MAG TPA: hypothetical protein VG142_15925 [Trebonia sp.]|nr:hypothetical protein [Trebonia sp.]